MPILQTASLQDRKRLLELFPIAAIREAWPDLKGTKEEMCFLEAERATPEQVIAFVLANLGRCKQHVHILNRPAEFGGPPANVEGGERVSIVGDTALYIVRTSYTVVLKDPLEETEIEFLWPILVQLTPQQVIVRLVILEKDVRSYYERQCYVVRRSIDEETVLRGLGFDGLARTDLHTAIKALWDDGFMDSPRAKFKKPMSMASEAMDEQLGIREHNPDLYEVLLDSLLLNTLFVIPESQNCGVSVFSADCVGGFLSFPRYSEAERNTDFVINQILQRNQ